MLAAFLMIIGLNIFLSTISFYIAYQSSKANWNEKIYEEALITLEMMFNQIMNEDDFLNEANCSRALGDTAERLLGMAQIDIFAPDGTQLKSWLNSSLDHYSPQPIRSDKAKPYFFDGKIKGYVAMYPTGFRNLEFNRRFISQMIHLSMAGMFATMILSLFLAFYIVGHFSREARNTARCLINLSKGSRNIQIVPAVTTEISEINKAALSLQDKLIKEEAIRTDWYENLAHDLRTPITAMKAQFIACRDGILALTPGRWETILGELAGMEGMIKDFAFISKLESPDFSLNRQAISSSDLLDYLTGSLSSKAWEKDITLVWDFHSFTFNCDFSLLTTAFSHLIKNAIQHSPAASKIQMSLLIESGVIIFRVLNAGQLTDVQIDQIFDPLYKTDASRGDDGSGMGLTISSKIALILGAKLQVEDLKNNQICFEMALLSCSSTVST